MGCSDAQASSAKTYTKVLATLVSLTVITVLAASVDFGSGNAVIALVIASIRASLVALFFMHLRHEKPMNAIIFVCGLVFLSVFLLMCVIDIDSRDLVRPATRALPPAASPSKPR